MTGRRNPGLTLVKGGKAYTLTELDESRDAALGCCECGAVIEPGEPLTYAVDPAAGFQFLHRDCAELIRHLGEVMARKNSTTTGKGPA